MSVLIDTSVGEMVFDLYVDDCPRTCQNFLKLCQIKYYNNTLFYQIQPSFVAQGGDPTNTGRGGESIYGLLYGAHARTFEHEYRPQHRHTRPGLLCMASDGPDTDSNGSRFYVTLAPNLHSLDDQHTVFGELAEGQDVLEKINEAYVDDDGRPYKNIRIRHTVILDDPTPNLDGLSALVPTASPEPVHREEDGRLDEDWVATADDRPEDEKTAEARRIEAEGHAVVLEMIGDLPAADVKPPDTHLFVCKLNPVTTEEDLDIIFARFGKVTDCSIVRDAKTGDSLSYGFVGFAEPGAAEEAYFKMNNCLIDDRRIKVDFSQSVATLWREFKTKGKDRKSVV